MNQAEELKQRVTHRELEEQLGLQPQAATGIRSLRRSAHLVKDQVS
jgi:hypothetical protein